MFIVLLSILRLPSSILFPYTTLFRSIVSLIFGDNVRKTIPWICLFGSGLVLFCDIIGRVIRYPFEIPASVILGVVGAIIFLVLLSKKRHAS